MDKIDFDGMTGKNKVLYEALWKGVNFDAPIEQTWNEKYEKYSSNSHSFSQASLLMNIFNITEPSVFEKKYKMAVGGSGNEGDKITTLHSSSLCALLHFYNVTKDNPLTLTVNGREIAFTDSIFEFKSPVIDPRYPSNMDVVLIGIDEDAGENVVFFLESKFAEYYLSSGKPCNGISNKYLDADFYAAKLYEKNFLEEKLGLEIKTPSKVKKNPDSKFDMVAKDDEKSFYIGGIKQMISHYCGIRNIFDKKYYDKEVDIFRQKEIQDVVENKIKKGAVVILGEIVFDHNKDGSPLSPKENYYKSYSEKYGTLAKEIASLTKDVTNFEIVTELLKYSDIKKIMEDKMEDKIKAFYYGK